MFCSTRSRQNTAKTRGIGGLGFAPLWALCLGILDSGALDSELEDLQFGKQGYHFGFKCLGFLCFEDYRDIGLS